MLVGLTGVVESPKWLADTGRATAAKRVLRRLRGHEFDVDGEIKGWGLESSRERNGMNQHLCLSCTYLCLCL